MSIITRRVVHWAAQECSWQQSGELSVASMIEGWRYAHRRRNRPITVGDILKLGYVIEPRKNHPRAFRQVDVQVGWDVKLPYELVRNAIQSLVACTPPLASITEDEATLWFRSYEDIHPFVDGNGRTGSILYNWLRGSLSRPIHPPNLWDDPRRLYASYPEPII